MGGAAIVRAGEVRDPFLQEVAACNGAGRLAMTGNDQCSGIACPTCVGGIAISFATRISQADKSCKAAGLCRPCAGGHRHVRQVPGTRIQVGQIAAQRGGVAAGEVKGEQGSRQGPAGPGSEAATLPCAATGTAVSSACGLAAASTCMWIASNRGRSSAPVAPGQLAISALASTPSRMHRKRDGRGCRHSIS